MKIYVPILVIFLSLSIVFTSCQSEDRKLDKEYLNQLANMYQKPEEGVVLLLALKYNLQQHYADSILNKYVQNEHFSLYDMMFSDEQASLMRYQDTTKLIVKLSKRYDISIQIIASLIYDYKIYEASMLAWHP